jgi:hypothetical protein
MEIAAAILAFIKAVPAFEKIYSQTIDLYFKQQEAADINRLDKKKSERDALIAGMIRQGVTDEELKDLRRALYNLNAR